MRQRVLYKSVRRLLPENEQIEHLVYLWSRHRLMVPYVVISTLVIFVVAFASGIEQWSGRLACGFGGGALAAAATSEYRVLVQTTRGIVLLRASRFRQVATEVIERLAPDTAIEIVGTTLVITEWLVDGRQYSVMKRFQQAMVAISTR